MWGGKQSTKALGANAYTVRLFQEPPQTWKTADIQISHFPHILRT